MKIQVPFQQDWKTKKFGQVSWFYPHLVESGQVQLRENYEFEDALKYLGYTRGRSALNILWEGSDGVTYTSGMSLLDDSLKGQLEGINVIASGTPASLFIRGTFTFKKQGTSVLLTNAKK